MQFAPLPQATGPGVIDAGGRIGRNFAPERKSENIEPFRGVEGSHSSEACGGAGGGRQYSEGARERLEGLLEDEGLHGAVTCRDATRIGKGGLHLAVWPLEHGFEAPDLTVIAEQDVLGDRLIRAPKKRRGPRIS